MDALPFCPLVRVVRKAASRRALPAPVTIGEHIKHVRSERELRQVDVAKEIGVSAATILHWEAGHTEPPAKLMPAIVRFLGYEPWPEPKTFGERMRVHRNRHGLSIKEAAKQAGVDEGTWAKWEGMTADVLHVGRDHGVFDKLLRAMCSPGYPGKPSRVQVL